MQNKSLHTYTPVNEVELHTECKCETLKYFTQRYFMFVTKNTLVIQKELDGNS